MSAPLVFLDTETTHLQADLREIWEVAIIRRDLNGDNEMHLYVEVDLTYADERSLEIGGFYKRSPQGRALAGLESRGRCVSKAKMVELVEQWTRDQAVVVGSNPGFDLETLDRDMRFCSVTPDWHYHPIDIGSLTIGYLRDNLRRAKERLLEMKRMSADPETEAVERSVVRAEIEAIQEAIELPCNSNRLTEAMGLDLSTARHSALGDAHWARDLYDAVMGS